jgi:hypothetical protein
VALLLALTSALSLAASASANNLFTLDANATSGTPSVVMDSAGNAYVSWLDKNDSAQSSTIDAGNDTPMYCKFAYGSTCTGPIMLNLPGLTTGSAASGSADGISGIFTVLGSGTTVYVVGARYLRADIVLWTSTNGGTSFDSGVVIDDGFNTLGPSNALLDGSNLLLSGTDKGLWFTATPISGVAPASLQFANTLSGGVSGVSLGLDQSGNPVETYWVQSSPFAVGYKYYSGPTPATAASLNTDANWTDATLPGIATDPVLGGNAPGSAAPGLYLESADGSNPNNTAEPTAIDVRPYNATTHTFGTAVALSGNPNLGFDDDDGAVAVTPKGTALAFWHSSRAADGTPVIESYVSTNGGTSFSAPTDVATCNLTCGNENVAAIDTTSSFEGIVAFSDNGGLKIADLTPIPPYVPPTPVVTPPTATSLATVQTVGSSFAASITIPGGTVGETDRAAVSGTNAGTASGTVSYALFSSSSCSAASKVFSGGTTAVTNGVAATSAPVTTALAAGKYYWVALYSGDAKNSASVSACGSEVLTVVPPAMIGGSGTSTSSTVTFTVSCASACTVTITLTVPTAGASAASAKKGKKKVKKPVVLGTGTASLAAGKSEKLVIHLSSAGKKLLAKHKGHLTTTLHITTKSLGTTQTTTKTLAIAPAKPKKKSHKK